MKYYTVEQVAKMFEVAESTVFNRLRAKKYPHARKNGKWAIPECCLAPGSTCLAGGSASVEDAELATMKAETLKDEAITANANQKRLKDEALQLRDLPETLQAREEAIVATERDLESRVASNIQVRDDLQEKEEKLNNKEGALNKALGQLKLWYEAIRYDVEQIVEYFNKHDSYDQKYHLPKLEDLTLPEEVYTKEEPVTPELLEVEELFNESEEE